MRNRILIITASLLCFFNSCNKPEQRTKHVTADEAPVEIATEKIAGNIDQADSSIQTQHQKQPVKKEQTPGIPEPKMDWDKKIIKTAFLNFEVKDYKSYYASFREKLRSIGGYVAQEEQAQSDYKIENTLVVKVPVDQFDHALALVTSGTEKINQRKVTSQDVSAEYIDTRSRIEAKKQVRQRYMDLMNQAKNMEEILNVQAEINGIQEEIEAATGRVEYLGQSAAYSTINITYYQVLNAAAIQDEPASPGFGARLGQAFKTGWSWIVDLLVGLVAIWPLALLGILVYGVLKRMKQTRSKPA